MPCYTVLHGRRGTALSSKGTASIWSGRQGAFQLHDTTDHTAASPSRHLKLRYTQLLQARAHYEAGVDDSTAKVAKQLMECRVAPCHLADVVKPFSYKPASKRTHASNVQNGGLVDICNKKPC